ncbi:MAG: MFS transporter [Proteobacteria bacterium]|nr:MFS transporter [Pseudomonadota bacterium]
MAPFLAPLRIREFRGFWAAMAISLLGDQLTFIALPWLVIKLTGDALIVGTVVAIAAVPRAIFILLGGALSDRFSPRTVLVWSNIVRMVVMFGLAGMVFTGTINLPVIYAIALIFGLADAFMFPAGGAMPPRLLAPEDLAAGNALVNGTAQLSLIIGPAAAGLLIAYGGETNSAAFSDSMGLSLVFLIDAFTFGAPVYALLFIVRDRFTPDQPPAGSNLIGNIADGLRYAWKNAPVRYFALLIGTLSLVFRGPFIVGVPVYADRILPEGAAAVGTIFSVLGIGSIIGAIVAGSFRKPDDPWLGTLLLIDFSLVAFLLLFMAEVHNLVLICIPLFLIGLVDGYVIVLLITFLQRHTRLEYMGRVMSVIAFANLGLFPIGTLLSGALIEMDLLATLSGAGALLLLVTITGLTLRPVRRLGL